MREMRTVEGIVIREADEADLPFISDSLKTSMRSSSLCREMSDECYEASFPLVLCHVIDGSVLVAHGELDPGDVVGWLSFTKHVLRFAFTKNCFRRVGIMSLLLQHSGLLSRRSFSFSVRGPLSPVLEKRFRQARYKPALSVSGLVLI